MPRAALLLLLSLAAFAIRTADAADAEPRRPNVLLILVDDLRNQLGCFGDADMVTPNIDRLADAGVRFDRHYVSVPICIPSRVSLLTGTRSERTRQVYGPLVFGRIPGVRTMGRTFSEAGYRTVSLGKVWHVYAGSERPDTFDVSDHPGWNNNYAGPVYGSVRKSEEKGRAPATEGPLDVPDEAYADGKIARKAMEELRASAKEGRPFLMLVGFNKPHLPLNAPKRYWDLYDAAHPPAAPAAVTPPYGMPDEAWRKEHELWEYNDGWTFAKPPNEAEGRHLRHAYAACVSFVDAQVGKLLEELDRLGLRDNTIVLLWSDHGFHLGELGMWTKHTNFENASASPLIISAPGFARGRVSHALVETPDLFPTLLDLCGLPPLDVSDGETLRPLLQDPDAPWSPVAYHLVDRWEPDGKGGKRQIVGRAIRTAEFRYVEWHNGWGRGAPRARELYRYPTGNDLERINLAEDPAFAGTVAELAEKLWLWENLGVGR